MKTFQSFQKDARQTIVETASIVPSAGKTVQVQPHSVATNAAAVNGDRVSLPSLIKALFRVCSTKVKTMVASTSLSTTTSLTVK